MGFFTFKYLKAFIIVLLMQPLTPSVLSRFIVKNAAARFPKNVCHLLPRRLFSQ